MENIITNAGYKLIEIASQNGKVMFRTLQNNRWTKQPNFIVVKGFNRNTNTWDSARYDLSFAQAIRDLEIIDVLVNAIK